MNEKEITRCCETIGTMVELVMETSFVMKSKLMLTKNSVVTGEKKTLNRMVQNEFARALY